MGVTTGIIKLIAVTSAIISLVDSAPTPRRTSSLIEEYQKQRLPDIPGYIPVYIRAEEPLTPLKSNNAKTKHKQRPHSGKPAHIHKQSELDKIHHRVDENKHNKLHVTATKHNHVQGTEHAGSHEDKIARKGSINTAHVQHNKHHLHRGAGEREENHNDVENYSSKLAE